MQNTSFRQAYQVLQDHAETLRNQQEPNIDDLLTIVNESVQAYSICKERIDAVEKALEQALNGAGAVERFSSSEDSTTGDASDEIPF